ncbi:MAG: hypothetical protein HKN82_15395, partial [Akkermansiaceae bacterium]|nr:hypothetical protein [Akkermansiaceae bacterium]
MKTALIVLALGSGVACAAWLLFRDDAAGLAPLANPGPLSKGHAFLENDCAACHTPHRGVEDANCIQCHANATSVLQRQPTAFHADIGNCAECHREHRHAPARMSEMDHELLAKIGMERLSAGESGSEAKAAAERLRHWLISGQAEAAMPATAPAMKPIVRAMDCASCHSRDDRHFDLFGSDCAACHETRKWTIPQFQHPSARSRECAHCHQAPPSHYMMHFKMISAKVAGKPHAKVSQCFECHQTTSWNDILGKGFY